MLESPLSHGTPKSFLTRVMRGKKSIMTKNKRFSNIVIPPAWTLVHSYDTNNKKNQYIARKITRSWNLKALKKDKAEGKENSKYHKNSNDQEPV